ncbi:ocs element-binding factor 1-like [Oryza brachyantha]|uniref:BZIP domain-containing protein n=1 Tax=Oryza brachyantha TaxID=4533 RepID=J3LN25_ORYBR|nr:ocs element-binding factor 1-like [Oryza brachyantha]
MSVAPVPEGARRAAAAIEEERQRNRKKSNRLSARRSRMKKQQYVDGLSVEVEQLRRENDATRAGVGAVLQRCGLVEQENRVLLAHARELCSTLQLRTSQLRLLGEVASVTLDVPDVADHLMQLYGGGAGAGGLVMPLSPPPPPLPPQIQMLLQSDVMHTVSMLQGYESI